MLIPAAMGAAGPGSPELAGLRAACAAAVSDLLLAQLDLLVVVGGGPADRAYDWPAAGSLQSFGVPWASGPGEPVLPLSLTVGGWLLAEALREQAGSPVIQFQAVATEGAADDCLRLGAKLAAMAPRVALLVMGDACARKAAGVHGAADPEAERYDAGVAAALAEADPDALARLDPGLDAKLMIAGRAAWQVLAGAAAGADAGLRGSLRCAMDPFDVTYLVALWDLAPAAGQAG
ncbi:MAG: hypothetical protein ABJB47_18155 [Actinomycetota bacterium]